MIAQQVHRRRMHNHINYRNTMLRTTKDNGIQLNAFSLVGVREQADRMSIKYFGPTTVTPGYTAKDITQVALKQYYSTRRKRR